MRIQIQTKRPPNAEAQGFQGTTSNSSTAAATLVRVLQHRQDSNLKALDAVQVFRDHPCRNREGRRMAMSEATKKAMIKKPESAGLPTAFETMSRLEQDMERMFHEFWRRPFLSLWDHERSFGRISSSNACS
jgi:hypothetical protein